MNRFDLHVTHLEKNLEVLWLLLLGDYLDIMHGTGRLAYFPFHLKGRLRI